MHSNGIDPWEEEVSIPSCVGFLFARAPLFIVASKHHMTGTTHLITQTSRQQRPCKDKQIIITHYNRVIMGAMASQTPVSQLFTQPFAQMKIKENKHQSSASLAFVRGIHQWPLNSPHKGPVTWKLFAFDGVIMNAGSTHTPRNVIIVHQTVFRDGCEQWIFFLTR